jgi:hypothetical protein
MAKPEMYLLKRANGFFYFRRRIPGKLRGLVDAGLFHRSLNTRNRGKAERLPYRPAREPKNFL